MQNTNAKRVHHYRQNYMHITPPPKKKPPACAHNYRKNYMLTTMQQNTCRLYEDVCINYYQVIKFQGVNDVVAKLVDNSSPFRFRLKTLYMQNSRGLCSELTSFQSRFEDQGHIIYINPVLNTLLPQEK